MDSDKKIEPYIGNKNLPLIGITYSEAEQFVEWLDQQFASRNGLSKYQVTIPDSDRWERAIRSDSNSWYPFGSEFAEHLIDRYAVIDESHGPGSGGTTVIEPAYSRLPNRFGISEAGGVVAEYIKKVAVGDDQFLALTRGFEKKSPCFAETRSTFVNFERLGLRLLIESKSNQKNSTSD